MTHASLAIVRDSGDDERQLVRRARRGEREAEYALYREHAPKVHRLVYRLCGDIELTDEVVQDTFVRAFSKLSDFREEASLGTWVHRIAVNVTLNAMRSEQRRAKRFTVLDESTPSNDARSADPDLRRALAVAVGELNEGQRTVFVMHALEGYTHVEIGEILGISEGTSKGRLFHARARLKETLAAFAPESHQ
jgi:RNA polymerase sigma-70 factor (ECF subfamily)